MRPRIGRAEIPRSPQFSGEQLHQMLDLAKQQLANVSPIDISLGKIIYNSGILLTN